MFSRKESEEKEIEELAPYAAKSSLSYGRKHEEKKSEFRTSFQRDKDRIIHSTAFRRLEYKTQVFVNHEGDHYRTRLTHSLEVSQIARSIARSLRLNEDLVEAISLGHDLGHGPFGHAGEDALSELMKKYGGFDHNMQNLRIVDLLEDAYADFNGLNLTCEVRHGIAKGRLADKKFQTLEAQLVNVCDEIAYDSHDLDDGLRSGLITEHQLEDIEIWSGIRQYVKRKYAKCSDKYKNKLSIRLLINKQVRDILQESEKRLKRSKIRDFRDVQKLGIKIISFSRDLQKLKAQLRKFLHKNLYNHYRVVRMSEKAKRVVNAVFNSYVKTPSQLSPEVFNKMKKRKDYRVICDYVAGMTDRFALDEYKKLFIPYEKV